ncbi:hypothetical protein CARUB_v10010708mg [Capsella rubella]|uniref:Uncharacterized protein n=1 Tax=Capsella rubella TaxID=81985 RepID=R0I4L0_9BRAS|nr:hypothetical protein CARUB_v10010708mg [Capsella rubella]
MEPGRKVQHSISNRTDIFFPGQFRRLSSSWNYARNILIITKLQCYTVRIIRFNAIETNQFGEPQTPTKGYNGFFRSYMNPTVIFHVKLWEFEVIHRLCVWTIVKTLFG